MDNGQLIIDNELRHGRRRMDNELRHGRRRMDNGQWTMDSSFGGAGGGGEWIPPEAEDNGVVKERFERVRGYG